MKRRIAFFDFDGTITTHDTLLEFIKYYKGTTAFYFGFLLYSPFLLAYKLKIIPNYVAKQKVLSFFFKGEDISNFKKKCDGFAEEKLPALIRPKAVTEIRKLQESGAEVVIVSASAENWIEKWASAQGIRLIGTRLGVKNNNLTGTIEGKNCYGDEKVCRIDEAYDLKQYNEIYCYGDSGGDTAMLKLATFPFYKPFR